MDYQLEFNKDMCILTISPLKGVFKKTHVPNEVFQFNDCYYFCSNLELLKTKALELKEQWRLETEKRLEKIININI